MVNAICEKEETLHPLKCLLRTTFAHPTSNFAPVQQKGNKQNTCTTKTLLIECLCIVDDDSMDAVDFYVARGGYRILVWVVKPCEN